ncbi:hypothetical protein RM555_04070 [Micromonospora sp. DSM 115977]|uniref:Uncharacterized protein n=1 Tax=Micromonospora reichwaldensis TaxID=3075516 RepID=A0ABU2WSA9_9ACTN|nr:hypothetical protein [Micromonospora sp. DSM 115977]MDT0528169.1 hypothetical protein [Micromonospora sp. DSM 115977]
MTAVAVSLAVFVVVLIAAFVFVGWRDRNRLSSPEDSAAMRDAASTQARYAAERHGAQGEVWRSGQTSNST